MHNKLAECLTLKVRVLFPRIRGTGSARWPDPTGFRFIPAYTGNGGFEVLNDGDTSVYPRVYGERLIWMQNGRKPAGLSPRIRGTVPTSEYPAIRLRFIPAYTGNGKYNHQELTLSAVYPRVYGERYRERVQELEERGLSPRIRGTGLAGWLYAVSERVIPADTGNGFTTFALGRVWPVYPRVYGERCGTPSH